MESESVRRLNEIELRAYRHEKELYRGNGRKPVINRLDRLEDDVANIAAQREEERLDRKKYHRDLIVGFILLLAAQIVAMILKH